MFEQRRREEEEEEKEEGKESNGERRDERTGVVYSTGKKSTTGATITPLTCKYYVVKKFFVCYHRPKR